VDHADAEQTNSIFIVDLRFAEQKKYLRLPALTIALISDAQTEGKMSVTPTVYTCLLATSADKPQQKF